MNKSLYFHIRRAHTTFENVKLYKPQEGNRTGSKVCRQMDYYRFRNYNEGEHTCLLSFPRSLANLLLHHKSFYVCAPFSNHFTSGQPRPQIYTQSPGTDLTGGHDLCDGVSGRVWNMSQPSCHAAEILSSDCCCLPFMACQCLKGPQSAPTSAPSFCRYMKTLRRSNFLEGYTPKRASSLSTSEMPTPVIALRICVLYSFHNLEPSGIDYRELKL